MMNSVLKRAVNQVLGKATPTFYRIAIRFLNSSSGSTYSFTPFKVTNFTIERNYGENWCDGYLVDMTISPKDYALLQDQGQNLMAIVTFTYLDQYGNRVFDPAPVQNSYYVTIVNPRDIRKAVPDIQHYTTPDTEIQVRLIEPAVYDLRHTKLNFVFQNANLSDSIHTMVGAYGLKTMELETVDNVHTFDHIEVPPYQGFDSAFWYLQNRYGVYMTGMNAYVSGGCAYIFGPFNTTPTYHKTATFYQTETGAFGGNHFFHQKYGDNISIVINSQPHSYDLSVAGSENHGTGFVFNRASRMSDGFTEIDPKLGAKFTEDPSLAVNLNSSRTMVSGRNNTTYHMTTDNPYPAMSRLASLQSSLMDVTWPNADPFALDPCENVIYCYDHNGAMVKKTGILAHATYKLVNIRRVGTQDMFACTANLQLRLSPNETTVLSS